MYVCMYVWRNLRMGKKDNGSSERSAPSKQSQRAGRSRGARLPAPESMPAGDKATSRPRAQRPQDRRLPGQGNPDRSQEQPKTAHGGPKSSPRPLPRPQARPKTTNRDPNSGPRRPTVAPRAAQDRTETPRTDEEAIGRTSTDFRGDHEIVRHGMAKRHRPVNCRADY